MVGGYPIPEVNRLMHAFMDGVREIEPETRFQVAFIGSWFDPPAAKETAFAHIDAGADIMYAERFGVSDAAQERGVLAIGNVIDTQADYPDTVVASAIWHFEPTLDAAIERVREGSFEAADYGVYSFMSMAAARWRRSAPSRTGSPTRSRRWSPSARPRSRLAISSSTSTTTSRARAEPALPPTGILPKVTGGGL
jgi:hypothetical protein